MIRGDVVGRYALFEQIAAGGMATVHYGRLLGSRGFSRTVAIKRLHPHLAHDAEFAAMFLEEARLAARVRHPNVVPTLDVVTTQGELFVVMDYVPGESLARLMQASKAAGLSVPPNVAAAVIVGVLHGLHAAHEAHNERGQPLNLVHRDVSPQNILVALDGVPRLVDFGLAKAAGGAATTRDGHIKGKIAYMAPEQIRGSAPTRLVDLYAATIVFWEMLTGVRLFGGHDDVTVLERALHTDIDAPSKRGKGIPAELDAVVLRGLSRDPAERFQTAREMAREIETVMSIASPSKVGEWVESIAGQVIAERAAKVIENESHVRPKSSAPVIDGDEPLPPLPLRFDRERSWVIAAALVAVAMAVPVIFMVAAFVLRPPRAPKMAARATSPSVTAAVTETAPASAVVVHIADASPVPSELPRHHAVIVRDFPSARPHTKASCNPPYTIDASGMKHYKLDCL